MMSSLIPQNVCGLLAEIEDVGFKLCLVGGAVRDFLKYGKLDTDLDFEIRADHVLSDQEWQNYYPKILEVIEKKKLKSVSLPYLITRVYFEEFTLEFSSPRLETFEYSDQFSHHNFVATLSSNLSFQQSFKRRDFTINSMGLDLNARLDPYHGKEDFKNELLRFIDLDFYRDSVRFLRLIRFSTKYKFIIDKKIYDNIELFNLSELSDYHFNAEMQKGDIALFLEEFRRLTRTYQLPLSNKFTIWRDHDVDLKNTHLKSKEDIFIFFYLSQPSSAKLVSLFFNFPEHTYYDLSKYYEALTILNGLNKDVIKDILLLGEDNFKNHFIYEKIKILLDKKIWREKLLRVAPKIENHLPFSIDDLNKIKVDPKVLMEKSEEDRGAYKIFINLKKWSEN